MQNKIITRKNIGLYCILIVAMVFMNKAFATETSYFTIANFSSGTVDWKYIGQNTYTGGDNPCPSGKTFLNSGTADANTLISNFSSDHWMSSGGQEGGKVSNSYGSAINGDKNCNIVIKKEVNNTYANLRVVNTKYGSLFLDSSAPSNINGIGYVNAYSFTICVFDDSIQLVNDIKYCWRPTDFAYSIINFSKKNINVTHSQTGAINNDVNSDSYNLNAYDYANNNNFQLSGGTNQKWQSNPIGYNPGDQPHINRVTINNSNNYFETGILATLNGSNGITMTSGTPTHSTTCVYDDHMERVQDDANCNVPFTSNMHVINLSHPPVTTQPNGSGTQCNYYGTYSTSSITTNTGGHGIYTTVPYRNNSNVNSECDIQTSLHEQSISYAVKQLNSNDAYDLTITSPQGSMDGHYTNTYLCLQDDINNPGKAVYSFQTDPSLCWGYQSVSKVVYKNLHNNKPSGPINNFAQY